MRRAPSRIHPPAFLSHTKSAGCAKNLPRRIFPPPPEIAGTPAAAFSTLAGMISFLLLRSAAPGPAARSRLPQSIPEAASKEKPFDKSDSSPAKSTTRSAVQELRRAYPSGAPAQMLGRRLPVARLPQGAPFLRESECRAPAARLPDLPKLATRAWEDQRMRWQGRLLHSRKSPVVCASAVGPCSGRRTILRS